MKKKEIFSRTQAIIFAFDEGAVHFVRYPEGEAGGFGIFVYVGNCLLCQEQLLEGGRITSVAAHKVLRAALRRRQTMLVL